MDRIVIDGMQFFGRHGVYRSETQDGQVFGVDIELELDLGPAAAADSLRMTVDYSEVFEQVRTVMEGPPLRLIETVADRIAAKLLAYFHRVEGIVVRVHKPRAPMPGSFSDVRVEIRRRRSG